jgi:hypothetical protein
VITHEYGHHVANNRRNRPWDALGWGTKRWGTHERVCPGVRSGKYFPGDQFLHYEDNPGEGFAESFAFRHYPNQIPWNLYHPDLAPDQESLRLIGVDVRRPWLANSTRSWSSRFDPGDPNTQRRRFVTPLDGSARITLTMPDSADYDLRILAGNSGKILATGIDNGADREVAYYKVCGRRTFRAEVHRYFGRGAFSVQVSRP